MNTQQSKFRTKIGWNTDNLVEITNDRWWRYTKNEQIIFKTIMLRSSLCEYSNAYMLAKRKISFQTGQLQMIYFTYQMYVPK